MKKSKSLQDVLGTFYICIDKLQSVAKNLERILNNFKSKNIEKSAREIRNELMYHVIEKIKKEFPKLPPSSLRYGKKLSIEEKKILQWLIKHGMTNYSSLAQAIGREYYLVAKHIKAAGGTRAFSEMNLDIP